MNYKHYTGRDWGVSQNYHLSLDSAAIGVDHCADVILYAMGLDPRQAAHAGGGENGAHLISSDKIFRPGLCRDRTGRAFCPNKHDGRSILCFLG